VHISVSSDLYDPTSYKQNLTMTSLSSASKPDCFCYLIFFKQHIINFGLCGCNLRTYINQIKDAQKSIYIYIYILNIYRAYVEWVWHF